MTIDSIERDYKRFESAQRRKANVAELYEEAMSYAIQNRETFNKQTEGSKNQNEGQVFDSTAPQAVSKFASNLQSSLVPPMKTWIKLQPGEAVPKQNQNQAAVQLEDIGKALFRNLQNSNFDTQISEAFHDLAAGTGALLVQPGTRSNPFTFVAVPMAQLWLEEVADGRVGAVFRRHEVAGRGIRDVWKDAILPPGLAKMIDEKPDDKIQLIEMTLPERVKILQKGENGRLSYVDVDGYRYTVLAIYEGKTRIVERKQRSNPWVVFRWSVVPGEVYGRGPLLQALADIKTLNKTKELTLKNAAMAIAGAWSVVDDGVINVNTIKIYPGAKIPVSSNEGGALGPTIKRLEAGGNFDVSQLIIQELKRSINEMLFADPLGPIDLPVKSATEVSLRQQELAKRIGSAFGRLQYELIAPLINRLLHIMEELGLIDLQSYRVDGQVIAIQHISPLAMAQDEEQLMAIMRYAQFMRETFGPELALMMMDPQKLGESIGKLLNVPTELLPSAEQWQQVKSNVINMASALAQRNGQVQQPGMAA